MDGQHPEDGGYKSASMYPPGTEQKIDDSTSSQPHG